MPSTFECMVRMLEGTSTNATSSGIVSSLLGWKSAWITVQTDFHLQKDLPQTVVMETCYLRLITGGSSNCPGIQPNTCSHVVYIQNVYPPHSGGQAHLLLKCQWNFWRHIESRLSTTYLPFRYGRPPCQDTWWIFLKDNMCLHTSTFSLPWSKRTRAGSPYTDTSSRNVSKTVVAQLLFEHFMHTTQQEKPSMPACITNLRCISLWFYVGGIPSIRLGSRIYSMIYDMVMGLSTDGVGMINRWIKGCRWGVGCDWDCPLWQSKNAPAIAARALAKSGSTVESS